MIFDVYTINYISIKKRAGINQLLLLKPAHDNLECWNRRITVEITEGWYHNYFLTLTLRDKRREEKKRRLKTHNTKVPNKHVEI